MMLTWVDFHLVGCGEDQLLPALHPHTPSHRVLVRDARTHGKFLLRKALLQCMYVHQSNGGGVGGGAGYCGGLDGSTPEDCSTLTCSLMY